MCASRPGAPSSNNRHAMQKGDAMRAYYSPILVTIAIAALIAGCSTTNPEGTDASGAPVTDATKKPGAGAQTGPIAKIDVTKPGAVTGAAPRLKTGPLAQPSIYYALAQFALDRALRGRSGL